MKMLDKTLLVAIFLIYSPLQYNYASMHLCINKKTNVYQQAIKNIQFQYAQTEKY